jgi:hypothetical protein
MLGPVSTVIHEALAVAVHEHWGDDVDTTTTPLPPALESLRVEGKSVVEQPDDGPTGLFRLQPRMPTATAIVSTRTT